MKAFSPNYELDSPRESKRACMNLPISENPALTSLVQNPVALDQNGPFAKLLIITHESVGEKMAGPSIRAWELARSLGAMVYL